MWRCVTGWWRPPARRRPIIARLNKELNAALATEDVKSRLATEGAEALPGTPEAYAADIDREEKKWGGLVKKLGLKWSRSIPVQQSDWPRSSVRGARISVLCSVK